MDQDSLVRLDTKADELKMSRSEAIRDAIEQYVSPEASKDLMYMQQLLTNKDSEIAHLRYLTNDLRSLADNLASKVPMLTGPTEERKHWWKFW